MADVDLRCPYCGFLRHVERQTIPAGATSATCPRCGQRFSLALADNSGESSPGSAGSLFWESAEEKGWWGPFWGTARDVLVSPATLFRNLPRGGGWRQPLAFGLLAGSLGNLFAYFWQFVMAAAGMGMLGGTELRDLTGWRLLSGTLVAIPALVLAELVLSSAAIHLCLRLVGGQRGGFQATFRVMAYAQAARLWGLVPVVGGWIGMLWRMVIQVVGLREVHRISYGRLVLALSIPFLLILGFAVISLGALYLLVIRPYLGFA